MSKPSLEIGVKYGLQPFEVDLYALTRGLVVVGQSGCGKSYLLGRIIEELARKTSRSTRILIIDTNSDFPHGLEQKERDEFEQTLNGYKSAGTTGEFDVFQRRELRTFDSIVNREVMPQAQVFGLTEDFKLSWAPAAQSFRRFSTIVKAGQPSTDLWYAYQSVNTSIKPNCRDSLLDWGGATYQCIALKKKTGTDTDYLDIPPGTNTLMELTPLDGFLQLGADIASEVDSGIWRTNPDEPGIPERLFASSRLNILSLEGLRSTDAKNKTLTYVLLSLLDEARKNKSTHVRAPGGVASPRKLPPTFIVIDEAQNFAPANPSTPLHGVLGEIIHHVAAEGRKYGLFLVLVTQRPEKVKRGLLGECDNAVIMKMNSRSDLEYLSREMRVIDSKLLDSCLYFQGKGNAIALGEMTKMAPHIHVFSSAPRRSVEGGTDLKSL